MRYEKEKKGRKIKLSDFLFLLIFILLGILTGIILIQKEGCGKGRTETPALIKNTGGGIGFEIGTNKENRPPYEYDTVLDQGVVIAGRESITIPANKKEVDFLIPKKMHSYIT